MLVQVQIIKIHIPAERPEHHSAITKYMSSNGAVWEKAEIIGWLEGNPNLNKAFVLDKYGDRAYCEVVYPKQGNPYLKTKPDGIKADNLLSLPRF